MDLLQPKTPNTVEYGTNCTYSHVHMPKINSFYVKICESSCPLLARFLPKNSQLLWRERCLSLSCISYGSASTLGACDGVLDRAATISCGSDAVTYPVCGWITKICPWHPAKIIHQYSDKNKRADLPEGKKHSLARGLEERDPEDISSCQINFQCVVFCVTLILLSFFVVFCVIVFPMITP